MEFTIGEAAQKLQLSIHTLRYYEKEGLLLQVKRAETGQRLYTPDDLQWIYMIRCLRDTGMPIRDIKQYIELFKQGQKTIPKRKEILIQHQKYVDDQIRLLQKTQHLLEKKLEYYEQIEQSFTKGKTASDNCSDYFTEWEDFKKISKEALNE